VDAVTVEESNMIYKVRDATIQAIANLEIAAVERLGARIKKSARVFTVGLGGSAAHASHCACDLVKLGGVESICLVDNVSAYSAGVNDDGSEVFVEMLRRHRFDHDDMLLIFSVGGGSLEKGVSTELVQAAKFTRGACAAIVGRRGDVCEYADPVVQIPCPDRTLITYVAESVMPLIWHALIAGQVKKGEPVWR
jgi:D-sedoheptulose 7-phosphate isomerase